MNQNERQLDFTKIIHVNRPSNQPRYQSILTILQPEAPDLEDGSVFGSQKSQGIEVARK